MRIASDSAGSDLQVSESQPEQGEKQGHFKKEVFFECAKNDTSVILLAGISYVYNISCVIIIL